MECKSSKTTDLKSEIQLLTRPGVDENTVLFSVVSDKTGVKAVLAVSRDIIGYFQSDAYTVDEEQTIIDKDIDQELNGQHPVSSGQQVDKPLILSCEFKDTTEIKTDVNVTTAIIQITDDKIFFDHSLSIGHENEVTLHRASYPQTIEGCIKVIDELRQTEKALHLTIDENEHLLECLQSDLLGARQELDEEREHWKCEHHGGYHEVRNGRGHGGGNRTRSHASTHFGRGDGRRSKSSGSATWNLNSRQFDRRPADQRRGTTLPSYNMNRVLQGGRRDGQEGQNRNREEGHPWTYSRGAHPRKKMLPSFVRGEWGASREGNNNTFLGQTKLGQKRGERCFKCDNLGRCTKGTCLASNTTCKFV